MTSSPDRAHPGGKSGLARIVLTVVLLLLTLVVSAAAVVGGYARDVRVPTWFGVRSENLVRAERAGAETWRFALLGDVQQGLGALRTALERIRSEQDLAFAVVCGDLVNQKSLPHYRVLFAAIERETPGVPVLTVPGNHDDPLLYREHLGPRFWWARVGPDLIVGVDTSEVESPGPMLSDLAKVLATPDIRHRMVFMHRPTARPGRVRQRFAPLAKVLADGRVDAVFAGHLHHFESFRHEGVLYVTNGRGGDLTGGTVSKASLALVTVGPDGISADEVKLGERSEIFWLAASGLATRVYEPLGRLGVILVAVLLAATSVLIAPPGGRKPTAEVALLSALPATGLPMLALLLLGPAVLVWNRRVRFRSTLV